MSGINQNELYLSVLKQGIKKNNNKKNKIHIAVLKHAKGRAALLTLGGNVYRLLNACETYRFCATLCTAL